MICYRDSGFFHLLRKIITFVCSILVNLDEFRLPNCLFCNKMAGEISVQILQPLWGCLEFCFAHGYQKSARYLGRGYMQNWGNIRGSLLYEILPQFTTAVVTLGSIIQGLGLIGLGFQLHHGVELTLPSSQMKSHKKWEKNIKHKKSTVSLFRVSIPSDFCLLLISLQCFQVAIFDILCSIFVCVCVCMCGRFGSIQNTPPLLQTEPSCICFDIFNYSMHNNYKKAVFILSGLIYHK